MLNIHTLFTAPAPTATQAIVQGDGRFSRIDVSKVRELFNGDVRFRDAVLSYTSLFLDQVMQNLVCNRLHPIEQRLAKWRLIMRDRIHSDELQLTQEFLSYMLRVDRPGVSIAVSTLETDGPISNRRNWIGCWNASWHARPRATGLSTSVSKHSKGTSKCTVANRRGGGPAKFVTSPVAP